MKKFLRSAIGHFLHLYITRLNLSRYRRQINKWLIRLSIAMFAAFFGAIFSLILETGASGIGAMDKVSELGNKERTEIINNKWFSRKLWQRNSPQLLVKGRELFQAEQFDKAATNWEQAASEFKAAGDKLNEALALVLLSLAYQQLGKWQEATDTINSGLSLIRNSGINTQESTLILAQALNTQGYLQLALGQPEDALKTWQQAAATYSQVNDLEGEIGSQINQAQAMQSLGQYRRARKILESVESSLENQPNSLIKATSLRSLGNALRVIGDLEKSRKLLQKALKIGQELENKQAISAAQFSLGNTAYALANRATEAEDISKANTEVAAAVKAYQEAAATSTVPSIQVVAKVNQFKLLVDNQQLSEAQDLRSQISLNKLLPSRRSVYAHINFAQSLIRLKKNSEFLEQRLVPKNFCTIPHIAISEKPFPSPFLSAENEENLQIEVAPISWSDVAKILATAVQQARSIKDRKAESFALGSLGELYNLTGQSEESYQLTQQAVMLAQSINATDISYRWQWQLGQLFKEQSKTKEAIEAYTVAVDTLKSLRSDLVAVNPDNPDVQFSFRDSIEPVYRQLVDLLLTAESEPSQENLRQARQVIESLQLAELDNFFQEPCTNAKPVQIDQVDPKVAVFYPIILPDKLAVILSLPNPEAGLKQESILRYYAISKPKCQIESMLNKLKEDLGIPTSNRKEVLSLSQQVYDWIVRPAEADIENAKIETLVFVLDGLLRNIPMGALHDGKQYLIEKYSIAITPGLQLVPPQPIKQEQLGMLAAGLSEASQGFNALPNVMREISEIKRQVTASEVLLNELFTEKNIQKALNSIPFPVVHIATHGQFSSSAETTYILTWDGKINVKELDNLLRRREREENSPIELLVFSACETAAGDSRAALGLAGVAVRAGARSTVATLWQVNDRSTASLMTEFYRELAKAGITKSEALRQAQISLLNQKNYKFPYYWAPYVLVGNWR